MVNIMTGLQKDFDEYDFLNRFAVAMDLMGFQTELVEIEGYPLSIEFKLIGYEELPVDAVAMFLPVSEVYGDEVRVLQIYFSLYDQELPEDKFLALENICNHYNMNTATGCYGVQEDILRICYKQGIPMRCECGVEHNLHVAMDTLIMMALSMDSSYDEILSTILKDF